MTEDEKFNLKSAKFSFVITDPYPEIAEYQIKRDACSGFALLVGDGPQKPDISPHKAWHDGFTFAWKLIEQKLESM